MGILGAIGDVARIGITGFLRNKAPKLMTAIDIGQGLWQIPKLLFGGPEAKKEALKEIAVNAIQIYMTNSDVPFLPDWSEGYAAAAVPNLADMLFPTGEESQGQQGGGGFNLLSIFTGGGGVPAVHGI